MGIGPEIRLHEIASAAGDWYRFHLIPCEVIEHWDSPRDVARDIVAHAAVPLVEAEVLERVRKTIAEGWDIPLENVTPDVYLIGGGLRLDCLPFMHPSGGPNCDPTIESRTDIKMNDVDENQRSENAASG